ncbi:hypothetical protein [Taibaiella chishuiensis]|uniref:DUF4136 domain-containing protein n=1 Tax=Taibaiella chishuiensis TaxID=1434707 RepID=A0A2P8DB03_9BACT|nr:hypothetical protein [Taibaiella chishuiensis]PSK94403.1 hypothetical protein B0I18_101559 [Taibaiella chishuiensis]
MKTTSTFRLYLSLFLCLVAFSACNKPNQFDVNFFFPEAKTNGTFTRFVAKYALSERGIPVDGDDLLSITDGLQKEFFGGVGMSGTITIDDQNISFEPTIGSSLLGTGFKSFQIPIRDITEVDSKSFLVISKAVLVNTPNGSFSFYLTKAKHWYNPLKYEDEEIIKMIKSKMGR